MQLSDFKPNKYNLTVMAIVILLYASTVFYLRNVNPTQEIYWLNYYFTFFFAIISLAIIFPLIIIGDNVSFPFKIYFPIVFFISFLPLYIMSSLFAIFLSKRQALSNILFRITIAIIVLMPLIAIVSKGVTTECDLIQQEGATVPKYLDSFYSNTRRYPEDLNAIPLKYRNNMDYNVHTTEWDSSLNPPRMVNKTDFMRDDYYFGVWCYSSGFNRFKYDKNEGKFIP